MAEYDSRDPTLDLDDDELIQEAVACARSSRDHTSKWRPQARESYAFVANDQWSAEDLEQMREMNRPALTFNRVEAVVEAISGQEANARHETKFNPRSVEDAGLSEAINQGAKWMSEQCDAGYEEAEAFRDVLICGMGVTHDSMDYETEETGKWVRDRGDPLEMYWDPSAKKKNLSDRRWDLRITDVDTTKLRMEFPDLPDAGSDMWSVDLDEGAQPHDQDAADEYKSEEGAAGRKYARTRVGVYQWYKLEDVYLADFPTGDAQSPYRTEKIDAAMFGKIESKLKTLGIRSVRVRKRCYYRAILANGAVLKKEKSPCDGFTTNFITGRRDRNNGTFYGIVEPIKDPQRWSNKFFSSMIDIVAANAKGGVMAETGAFKNPQQAEASWANPKRITWLETGALSNGRVQQKPLGAYPTAMDKLLQFAVSSIRDISGVNVEMLGMADRDQPGIVEAQRKQSALSILAPFFDALKSYRKEAGKTQLAFLRRYIPAQTLQEVLGPQYAQYVPAIKDEKAVKFNIIVDEAPTSQNMKDLTWQTLGPMLPNLMEMGFPVPPSVLEYLPLPRGLVEEWKALLSKPDPAKEALKALEVKKAEADVAKGMSQAQANMARAESAQATARKPDTTMVKAQIDMAKGQQDMQLAQQKMQLERQKAEMELQIRAIEAQMDQQHQEQEHQMAMVHSTQEHAQSMAVNAQMGEAKIEQMKKQQDAKPAPRGDA